MTFRAFIHLAIFGGLTFLPALGYVSSDSPFEKIEPTYTLPDNPHPSLPELIERLEKETLKTPNDPELWYQLGLAYTKAGRTTDAIAALQKTVGLDSVHVRAWEALGTNLVNADRKEEALAAFQKAASLGASDFIVLNNYALFLLTKGDLDEADKTITKATQIAPKERIVWNTLGLIRNEQKRYQDSADAFNKALDIDPNYAIGHVNLAKTLGQMKQMDAAVDHLKKAIALDPNLSQAWVNLSAVYIDKEMPNDALSAAQQGVKLDPENGRAWAVLGMAQMKLKQNDDAIASLQKALTFFPKQAALHGSLARAYGNKEEWKEACDAAHRALEFDPLNSDALFTLSHGEFRAGHSEQAVEAFHQMFDILNFRETVFKDDKYYAEALSEYTEATVRIGHTDDADKIIQQAVAVKPDNPLVLAEVGSVRLQQRRYAEAVDSTKKAIAIDPTPSLSWLHLGYAYIGLKQSQDALDAFQKTVSIQPDNFGAWFGQGQAYELLKQPDKALDAYRKSAQYHPNILNLGRIATLTPDETEATKCVDQIIALYPGASDTYALQAATLGRFDQWDKAEVAARKATELAPNDPGLWASLYNILVHEKKFHDAISAAQKAVDTSSKAPPALAAVCWGCLAGANMGDAQRGGALSEWQTALEALNHATSLDPQNSHYWFLMSLCQKNLGNADAANASAAKCASLGGEPGQVQAAVNNSTAGAPNSFHVSSSGTISVPTDASAKTQVFGEIVNAVQPLLLAGKNEEALAAAQHESELHPENGTAWFYLGEAQMASNHLDDAIISLKRSTEMSPQGALAWQDLAKCLAMEKRVEEAIPPATKAVDLMPDQKMCWDVLAMCVHTAHGPDGLIQVLPGLLQNHPQAVMGWLYLSQAQSEKSDIAGQTASLQKGG